MYPRYVSTSKVYGCPMTLWIDGNIYKIVEGGGRGAEAISVSLCSLVEISVLIFNTNLAALVTNGKEWTQIGWDSRTKQG